MTNKAPKTFLEMLEAFKTATSRSKKLALDCSQMALQHFADHGNVHYLQLFHDAMPKNFLRRGAFIKWACDHAPLVWKESKFRKDTSEAAVTLDLARANKVAFWDYNPETPILNYNSDNVIAAFEAVIKRFDNGDKTKPADNAAQATFEQLRAVVEATIAKRANINEPMPSIGDDNEEEAQAEAA
jgi:hypothetical protein